MDNIKIFPHQKKVVDFIKKDTNRGVLVFHSVGSGKTVTALLSAKELLKMYPDKNVVIATPASLVTNFSKEMEKLKDFSDIFSKRLAVFSYQRLNNILAKGESMCKNNIFIIDEAHNINGGGETYKSFFRCAKKAFKVILLTGTPVKNNPGEIAKQLSLLEGTQVSSRTIDNITNIGNPVERRKIMDMFFKCKISYFKTTDKENYPLVKEHVVNFEMTIDYYKAYYLIQQNVKRDIPDFLANTKNLIIFLNGIRRASNTLSEPSEKIKWIANKIVEDLAQNKKILIYSNWISAGIKIIRDLLQKAGIPFSEVSGGMSREVKDKNIKDFNTLKTKILLISSSGAEGLNLKEVRSVIVMEPHWNKTRTDQVIGRASRYMSHSKLPLKDRHVDVYHLIITKPREFKVQAEDVKHLIKGVSKDYKKLDSGMYNLLKKEDDPENFRIINGDIINIKNKSKEFRIMGDSMPSADIILFVKANEKQITINKFYDWLSSMSIENDRSC